MKTIITAILVFAAVTSAETGLAYHGSAPQWLSSQGTYRGTWFHVQDFIPGATGFSVEWVEIWLMDLGPAVSGEGVPLLEIWNEDFTVLLGVSEVTGSEVWFSPAVEAGEDFWCVLNTEMCTETIYLMTDGDPDGHSFFSDDGLIWEEYNLGEFFISACNISQELNSSSWGGLKALF